MSVRAALATLVLLVATAAFGQGAPVPVIPWDLPDAPRLELETQRGSILKRIEVYDGHVSTFMARCRTVTTEAQHAACAKEDAALGAEEKGIGIAVDGLATRLKQVLNAPCMVHERQLQRDKAALGVQLKSIAQGVRELEELGKAAEDARKDALMLGASAVLGPLGKYLETKVRSATAFKGWLTRYGRQLRAGNVPFEALQGKIEQATRGLVAAQMQVGTGIVLRKTMDLQEMWNHLTTVGMAIGTGLAQGEATFREVLSNPTLRPFILDDATMADVHRTLFDIAAGAMPLFAKISPQYTVAAFVVDAGFEYKKYESLRSQVMQRHGLTDQMLRAVDALKQQTERTVAALQECRRAAPTPSTP